MDYFRPYTPSSDDSVVAAWDCVATAADIPSLRHLIAERGAELFPEFSKRYAEIRALPRSVRRALQRNLAASRELAIPAEWRRRLAYSLAGAALLLALENAPAQAATIKVGGGCTLVNAINSANSDSSVGGCTAGSGADIINLPKGAQILTAVDNSTYGVTGLPVITTDITIQGNNSFIERANAAPQFRLLAVGPSGTLTINKTKLLNGYSPQNGGAIYNYRGHLYINDSTISGNHAHRDGGGIASAVALTVIDSSTISRNTATIFGGGFRIIYGKAYIQNTTITGNTAVYNGGGISQYEGLLSLFDGSVVSRNSTQHNGGGVDDRYGKSYLNQSTITRNVAAQRGGGIFIYQGLLSVFNNSIISKNNAGSDGGGIYSFNSKTYISDTRITGNKAVDNGGGIFAHRSYLVVDPVALPSKISKNSAGVYGGGVENYQGTFNLINSTISGNKANVRGGGVDNTAPYTFNYISGTISGNKAPSNPNHYP